MNQAETYGQHTFWTFLFLLWLNILFIGKNMQLINKLSSFLESVDFLLLFEEFGSEFTEMMLLVKPPAVNASVAKKRVIQKHR